MVLEYKIKINALVKMVIMIIRFALNVRLNSSCGLIFSQE